MIGSWLIIKYDIGKYEHSKKNQERVLTSFSCDNVSLFSVNFSSYSWEMLLKMYIIYRISETESACGRVVWGTSMRLRIFLCLP